MQVWYGRFIAVLIAVAAFTATPSADLPGGVSLRVTEERVPPGGTAQMKFEVTEPKPISTGRGRMAFGGFPAIDGVAVISPAEDTFGVAIVNGGEIALSLVSPSATFGTLDDYPLVTVTGRVASTAPLGAVFPFNVDQGSLEFRDGAGVVYPVDVKNGSLTIAPGISIHEVRPGSANLPAGAIVTVLGSGFVPGTEIDFGEADVDSTHFVSSSRIDVVLEGPARMHGMRIRARNPGQERIEYFSFQRTSRLGSSIDPILSDAVPLFPPNSKPNATVDVQGHSTGIAVQNIQKRQARITAQLFAANGTLLSTKIVKLPSNRFFVKEISELFQVSYGPGSSVRIRGTRPVQVMGIAVSASGAASPLLPH
jgi:hypothetical protein